MTPEDELKKRINDLESYQKDIESQLLEQEHRPFTVIKNYLNRDKWERDDKRRKSVKLAILWRLFFSPATMAATGGTIGLITILILIHQNGLLTTQNILTKDQNNKFEYQNKKIIEQNNLIEAERRSAQVFVMSDVLQDLQKELTKIDRPKDSTISNILAGRIVAVSRAMKPYRLLQADTLSNLISPERGQLLIILKNSGINKNQLLEDILYSDRGDFSYSELLKADLSEFNLSDINLSNADLTDSFLQGTILEYANFTHAELSGTDLRDTDFSNAVLRNAQLLNSEIIGSNLSYADFTNANLRNADLTFSNLANTIFKSADLRGANLDSATTIRKDWINYIKDTLKLKGSKRIDSLYTIEFNSIFPPDSIFLITLKNKKLR